MVKDRFGRIKAKAEKEYNFHVTHCGQKHVHSKKFVVSTLERYFYQRAELLKANMKVGLLKEIIKELK